MNPSTHPTAPPVSSVTSVPAATLTLTRARVQLDPIHPSESTWPKPFTKHTLQTLPPDTPTCLKLQATSLVHCSPTTLAAVLTTSLSSLLDANVHADDSLASSCSPDGRLVLSRTLTFSTTPTGRPVKETFKVVGQLTQHQLTQPQATVIEFSPASIGSPPFSILLTPAPSDTTELTMCVELPFAADTLVTSRGSPGKRGSVSLSGVLGGSRMPFKSTNRGARQRETGTTGKRAPRAAHSERAFRKTTSLPIPRPAHHSDRARNRERYGPVCYSHYWPPLFTLPPPLFTHAFGPPLHSNRKASLQSQIACETPKVAADLLRCLFTTRPSLFTPPPPFVHTCLWALQFNPLPPPPPHNLPPPPTPPEHR